MVVHEQKKKKKRDSGVAIEKIQQREFGFIVVTCLSVFHKTNSKYLCMMNTVIS